MYLDCKQKRLPANSSLCRWCTLWICTKLTWSIVLASKVMSCPVVDGEHGVMQIALRSTAGLLGAFCGWHRWDQAWGRQLLHVQLVVLMLSNVDSLILADVSFTLKHVLIRTCCWIRARSVNRLMPKWQSGVKRERHRFLGRANEEFLARKE